MDAVSNVPRLGRRSVVGGAAAILMANAGFAPDAAAQAYPTRPIKMIVATGPGTVSDIVACLLAQQMPKALGQNMVVENVTGAGGLIGTEQMVRAASDGHTLAVINNNHVINPNIFKRIPFDTLGDITPISIIGNTPLVLVVNPKLPAQNLQGLLSLARSTPGSLTFGSAGIGTSVHLAAVLLTSEGKIELRHVPYKAGGQAVTDLLAGHIDMAFVGVAVAAEYIAVGQLRALGVTTTTRSDSLRDVPTLAEQGLADYEFTGWMVLAGPPNLPRPIVDRLHAELKAALALNDMRDLLSRNGVMLTLSSPEEAASFLRTELDKHAVLARRGGVVPN